MSAPRPLGATVDGAGTWFVTASSVAERIELVLFDDDGTERTVLDLSHDERHGTDRDSVELTTWSVRVDGVGHGQRYGFRVHGPGDPASGHACDPAKLLVDPAARRVDGDLVWASDLTVPGVDSAPFVPRSVVVDPSLTHTAVTRPGVAWDRRVVYEAHVGHLTARCRDVPPGHRGRYPGLAAPAVIEHLQRLGVTTLELLPVQQFVSERDLVADGRRNVWGYNPLAWGAPHAGYATVGGDPVGELREAVGTLHEAGIEVWLDVVVNHTCEGSLGSGPILSWRGFDNAATYRLLPGPDGLVDDDLTGCGNAVDTRSPLMRALIRQCLVRWVEEIGIDGFRFDLAATLIRGDDGPTAGSPWMADLAAEPALDGIALVAEPWDLGPDGYALGRFGTPWREWNDRFRDDGRDLWRGAGSRSAAASSLTGTASVLRTGDRTASTSINAVITHDGFTLADLVSQDEPLDGHGQRSWGGGAEGATTDPTILANRRRRQRALLGTVLCAQGVPMLSSGDEIGRSQGGSANGYTLEPDQWGLDWDEADEDLAAWVATAVALRVAEPALRRPDWVDPGGSAVIWRRPDGCVMSDADWTIAAGDRDGQALAIDLDGTDLGGHRVMLLLAPGPDPVSFDLPDGPWQLVLDASVLRPPEDPPAVIDRGRIALDPSGFVVLRRLAGVGPRPVDPA